MMFTKLVVNLVFMIVRVWIVRLFVYVFMVTSSAHPELYSKNTRFYEDITVETVELKRPAPL